MDSDSDENWLDSWPGKRKRSREATKLSITAKDLARQKRLARRKHLAEGFIADLSYGDDFEAIVSTGFPKIFRRHSAAPLRLKFVQKT
jgi:hypothetical protein